MAKKEYNDYKDKMQPYENLQKSDLEKRLKEAKEAERKKLKKKPKSRQKKKAKKKRRKRQKDMTQIITYENLAKNSE